MKAKQFSSRIKSLSSGVLPGGFLAEGDSLQAGKRLFGPPRIGIQMGWTLRPFIGAPAAPVVFMRETAIDNAYVEVFRVFVNALGF